MSASTDDVVSALQDVFDQRDDQGFVDLCRVHKLVAPVDQRETMKLLVPKKLTEARTRIATDIGFDPVRQEGSAVFVHFDLALEVVAYRRLDLKANVQKWKCTFGDAIKQLVHSVPELYARVESVFGDSGIRYTRVDGKFYFAAADMAKLVLWDDVTQTPSQRNCSLYVTRAGEKDEILRKGCERMFQFGNSKHSPILDINDTARLWVNLPGAKATAFRTQIISKWIRIFGGDLTLIDEIRQNRAIQNSLPDDNPARAFGDAVRERASDVTDVISHPGDRATDIQLIITRAVQTVLQPLYNRIELETNARTELENRLQVSENNTRQLTEDLTDANMRLQEQAASLIATQLESERLSQSLVASDARANILAVEIAGIRTAQYVEYRAEAFDNVVTLENFLKSPPTTAVRFKDLFRLMGIIGVKEEMSMACGRVTHRLAPTIGYRRQRGRDGHEYNTIDYRKSQVPIMLRGILETCIEHNHVFETEDGMLCICGSVRELKRAFRR